jgi:hypothetical protein
MDEGHGIDYVTTHRYAKAQCPYVVPAMRCRMMAGSGIAFDSQNAVVTHPGQFALGSLQVHCHSTSRTTPPMTRTHTHTHTHTHTQYAHVLNQPCCATLIGIPPSPVLMESSNVHASFGSRVEFLGRPSCPTTPLDRSTTFDTAHPTGCGCVCAPPSTAHVAKRNNRCDTSNSQCVPGRAD